jgi:tetratricopeptide (TPR) repeat protein
MNEGFEELLKQRLGAQATLRELIDPLVDAVQAYAQSGDADAVLGIGLDRAINRLAAAYIGSSEAIPAPTLVPLALVRWCQHTARRGTVSGELDRRESIRLFEQAIAEIPEFPLDGVPEGISTVVGESVPALRRLRLAHEGALKLLSAGQAASDRVRIREGIEILRPALIGVESESSLVASAWYTLAQTWQLWFELTSDTAALDQAIAAYRRSADGTPPGYDRANRYQGAYALLRKRAVLGDDETRDIDEAAVVLRAAIDALPSQDVCPARWLIGLAHDLLLQARRDRAAGPLDEALGILIGRIPTADTDELDNDQWLSLIAEISELKAELTGDPGAREGATREGASHERPAGPVGKPAPEPFWPSAPCDCARPARERALAISPDLSYAFGLAILDIEWDAIAHPDPQTISIGQHLTMNDAIFQWNYAAIRSLQAMGSPFLNRHALRLLRTAVEVIRRARPDADDWPTACSQFESEATRLTRRNENDLSCFDLLESTARLEAYRQVLDNFAVQGQRTTVSLYLELEAAADPEPSSPQRRGFTYLSERLGRDDAYLLQAPLTFLAFTTEDPVATFSSLTSRAVGHTEELCRLGCEELLAWAGLADRYWSEYLGPVAMGAPLGTTFITDALQAALEIWDQSSLLDALCRPATHLTRLPGDQRTFRNLLPPVIILRTNSGELNATSNGVAESRPGFAYDVIRHAGLVAAAERLTVLRDAPAEQQCWHQGCPVFATGLCHRWYAVPSAQIGHDACDFPREFAALAGVPPTQARRG